MLKEIINRARGQVRIRVECAFPERVLNLCSVRELAFWDLEWESETAFTCRLSRKDLASLRRAAEKLDCDLVVVGREGAPYFLRRFRHRTALVTGLTACALALTIGSFFVWDFEIEGNTTVPDEEIMRALENYGVGLGSFGLSLDGEDIRNHVLLDIPRLSWIAVNVSGCRAHVQVRERVEAPRLLDEQTPTNVVARRAGLVLQVEALDGVAAVLPGTAVTEGQLLISGVADLETFGARVMAGKGTARARTWYTLTTSMPLIAAEKQYTGRERTFLSLVLGQKRIKFFPNSSIEGAKYDKITKRYPCMLLGVPLPVTWVTEYCRFYETAEAAQEPLKMERRAETLLKEQLTAMVSPYGSVKSTLCTSRVRGDTLLVTLIAECEEEIGETVPIYTEDNIQE